ncbi:MAG: hypothetical protein QMB24_10440, partial [Spirosomataceae bacterium]
MKEENYVGSRAILYTLSIFGSHILDSTYIDSQGTGFLSVNVLEPEFLHIRIGKTGIDVLVQPDSNYVLTINKVDTKYHFYDSLS